MLVKLNAKSQVTIPSHIVKELGLVEGDMFDIVVEKGVIELVPVVVYPKETIERLERLVEEAQEQDLLTFDNVEDAINSLHQCG